MAGADGLTAREAKRLQTRERLMGAAIAEFKRAGMADADVGTIVAAAGVAHGTFFFHFPTKEHVLLELEQREEERIAKQFAQFVKKPHDLEAALREIVRLVIGLERRLGDLLFKDFLALHFSTTRPPSQEWTRYPALTVIISELQRAQQRGEIPADVDVMHVGVSFVVGLYALLITIPEARDARAPVLEVYLTTYLYGLRVLP